MTIIEEILQDWEEMAKEYERKKVKTMDRMETVDKMEESIIEALGYEQAFEALSKALSYDTKEDMYKYIMRMHEIE